MAPKLDPVRRPPRWPRHVYRTELPPISTTKYSVYISPLPSRGPTLLMHHLAQAPLDIYHAALSLLLLRPPTAPLYAAFMTYSGVCRVLLVLPRPILFFTIGS